MSPTIFRERGFRFHFFSAEESRGHVHVVHAEGEAKFWFEPRIELFKNYGLSAKLVADAQRLIEEHIDDIRAAWRWHFPG